MLALLIWMAFGYGIARFGQAMDRVGRGDAVMVSGDVRP